MAFYVLFPPPKKKKHKKNKQKNWPFILKKNVHLCCYSTKILAKLIAERIKLVLPYLIDQYQTGFLKGCYVGQNIVTIFNIIHYIDAENILAIMTSIDSEKTFDQIRMELDV